MPPKPLKKLDDKKKKQEKPVYSESFTLKEKQEIAESIKPITIDIIEKEFKELRDIGSNASTMSKKCIIGNNVVDYFTFINRLETRGKYNCNFYEFVANIEEFKKKKFIENMLEYYATVKNKNGQKHWNKVLKEVYNICISAINIIRPLVYMEIYSKYKPTKILDFCAGWGGAAVAACALNVEKYIGIEINTALEEPYNRLTGFLKKQSCKTDIQMLFQDALTVDYTKLDYDFVFTSPPYYFIQKYENNESYNSDKREMDDKFYTPIFTKVFEGLQPNGYFIINVNKEVYDTVLVKLFGEAHEIYDYKKMSRQNNYKEIVYVWIKSV